MLKSTGADTIHFRHIKLILTTKILHLHLENFIVRLMEQVS
jgi:hypothetical protein